MNKCNPKPPAGNRPASVNLKIILDWTLRDHLFPAPCLIHSPAAAQPAKSRLNSPVAQSLSNLARNMRSWRANAAQPRRDFHWHDRVRTSTKKVRERES